MNKRPPEKTLLKFVQTHSRGKNARFMPEIAAALEILMSTLFD